ncbi:hypothetical protein ACSXAD_07515 [Clostridium perfringens]
MKKIYKNEDVVLLKNYSEEVINEVRDIIEILDRNCGENRNINKDIGGYILIIETLGEFETLQNGMLKDILPEYTDLIEFSEGVNYTSSLFFTF